jgi:hypothetical protein
MMIVRLQDTTASAAAHVHQILGAAVPNVWVTAGITVGLLALVSYLIRVPHQYPLRGAVMAITTLAFLGCGIVLGMQIWGVVQQKLPDVKDMKGLKADIKAVEQHQIDKQPVGALSTYVPPMPGTDSATSHVQPSMNGLPSGTVWDEYTNQSVAEVVKYYADDENHAGWQVEFSAPNGMVLRRTITAMGQFEDERLRVLARPNIDRHGKKTEIEFELTRRLK